jgi:hypothetical protein
MSLTPDIERVLSEHMAYGDLFSNWNVVKIPTNDGGVELYTCARCGAGVVDTDQHVDWHNGADQ